MTKLQTHYMGLELAHPIVASASPLAKNLQGVLALERAGAAAIVLPSLFEEQFNEEQDALSQLSDDTFASAETGAYFNIDHNYLNTQESYLQLIEDAVKRCQIPIIASLNGCSPSGWLDFSRAIEAAGAHALELNIYAIPQDFNQSADTIERELCALLAELGKNLSIPIALKTSPFFTSFGHFAQRLADTKAVDALVMFNRFYQPDFDIDKLEITRELSLSSAQELRLPLTWIGMLHQRFEFSLAASTGVESAREVIKYLLAGADVVMTTSALLRNGPNYIQQLKDGLTAWLQARAYSSVSEMRGALSLARCPQNANYQRAQYIETLQAYDFGATFR